jgi:hypothetical protein
MIRVLIVDDDEGYLESLRELVERQPELSVVAEARDGLGAIELADEVEIDAAVIDVHMPLVDGATAIRAPAPRSPEPLSDRHHGGPRAAAAERRRGGGGRRRPAQGGAGRDASRPAPARPANRIAGLRPSQRIPTVRRLPHRGGVAA